MGYNWRHSWKALKRLIFNSKDMICTKIGKTEKVNKSISCHNYKQMYKAAKASSSSIIGIHSSIKWLPHYFLRCGAFILQIVLKGSLSTLYKKEKNIETLQLSANDFHSNSISKNTSEDRHFSVMMSVRKTWYIHVIMQLSLRQSMTALDD